MCGLGGLQEWPEEAIDVWPRGGYWLQDEACQVNVLRVLKFLRGWRVLRVWRVGGHKKPLMCGLGVAVGCRMKHALRVWRVLRVEGLAVGCRMKHAKSAFEGF